MFREEVRTEIDPRYGGTPPTPTDAPAPGKVPAPKRPDVARPDGAALLRRMQREGFGGETVTQEKGRST